MYLISTLKGLVGAMGRRARTQADMSTKYSKLALKEIDYTLDGIELENERFYLYEEDFREHALALI